MTFPMDFCFKTVSFALNLMRHIQYLVFSFCLFFILSCSSTGKREKETYKEHPADERGTVKMVFNFGVTDRVFTNVPWRKGQSVYDLLMQLDADILSFSVMDTLYGDLGHLILEIDQIRNSSPNYWVYCVNGKKANKGVDDYKLKDGDRVNWFYTSDPNPCGED